MKLVRTPAAELFDAFFAIETVDQTGVRVRRIRLVEERLRACLEDEFQRVLVTGDLVLVAAEREREPLNAVARVGNGEDLIYLFSIFLSSPWLLDDPTDRRVQFRVVEHFTAWLIAHKHVRSYGLECALLDLRYAINSGRRALRTR